MKELKDQLVSALLVILTVAAAISAGINFQQQSRFHLVEDGVTWLDESGKVEAIHIVPGSQAEKAGLRTHDILVSISGKRVDRAIEATEILTRLGAWTNTEYRVVRDGVEIKANVIVGEGNRDSTVYYQYAVGAAYLAIGLFVYFRRGAAPKSVHFYILCLASFVLSCFHYSGKLNNFDKVIYWGNVTAGILAPTIFLHFCLTFAPSRKWFRRRLAIAGLYLPAILFLAAYAGVATGIIRTNAPLLEVRWLLDRAWLVFLCTLYLFGGLVLALQYRREEDPVVRQQLKWLRNGALVAAVPFTFFYAVPFLMGAVPSHLMKVAVLSLAFMPLSWAYAILRHRLMDVDLIFQQGYVYTLATLCILGIFYGLLFALSKASDISGTAMVALVLIATFVFQPIRKWIQELLDRYVFYKDRYDYRLTLSEFARDLSSQTDLDAMLALVGERLVRTLQIQHVAFFLYDEEKERFQLQMATRKTATRYPYDLSFLSPDPGKPFLFFERTRFPFDVVSHDTPASVRHTIAELDLTYYLPCSLRGRTIAYLGVSRTDKGDFLSSEDVDLLGTMAGSVGIAMENARLYSSLQRKVEEYERLKEFSENIVESINVGILAADLEDRVESWNTQIERLTGIPRDAAVGQRLSDLFPLDLCDKFQEVRGQTGVHNIYKFQLRPEIDGVSNQLAKMPVREATLNVAIAPLISKDFEQIGRLIIFDDVTDRAELEQRLVQADKLSSIGLLAAGVAHEVNTPLAVISTYAQMLAKQVSGDEQKSKLLEKIARQTFRASEIVNSLLNFSRTSPTEFDAVDLNKVIRETAGLIEHQLQTSAVSVTLSLDERLPSIQGNAGKLQQVFLNLFLNARDAMDGGGLLAIKTWADEGLVRVDVADSGSGIAPENLSKIYDPFFTTKGAKKGTGLGLSVTYGIVREHAGDIEVESQQGTGTKFHLEFPHAANAQKSTAPARGAIELPMQRMTG